LAIFVSFSRLATNLPRSIEILLTFHCNGQKTASADIFKLRVKPTFWKKILIIYENDIHLSVANKLDMWFQL